MREVTMERALDLEVSSGKVRCNVRGGETSLNLSCIKVAWSVLHRQSCFFEEQVPLYGFNQIFPTIFFSKIEWYRLIALVSNFYISSKQDMIIPFYHSSYRMFIIQKDMSQSLVFDPHKRSDRGLSSDPLWS